jgi:arylsulfatase A-like enzyme
MFQIQLGFMCLLTWLSIVLVAGKAPNILFLLTDDWGYGDSWNCDGLTPATTCNDGDFSLNYFKSLWNNGIKMSNYYVNPTCSPTRSSFLTGKYAYRSDIVDPYGTFARVGMNENDRTLAQYLKEDAGYYTVLSGKWHLGYNKDAYLPTNRGFDEALWMASAVHTDQSQHKLCVPAATFSSFGLQQTTIEEYQQCIDPEGTIDSTHPRFCQYDMWSNEHIDKDNNNYYEGTYDSDVWLQNNLDFLDNYYDKQKNTNKQPWFLYWAENAPHSPTVTPPSKDIFDGDIDYLQCNHLSNPFRKQYCQMLTHVEHSVKLMIDKLKELGIYDDTLIIISSDNGGEPGLAGAGEFTVPAFGQAYPLRGSKFSSFEGGIRAPAFLTGGYVENLGLSSGASYDGVFHVSDWLPTLLSMVEEESNIDIASLPSTTCSCSCAVATPPPSLTFSCSCNTGDCIDGINQWNNIKTINNNNPLRNEIVIITHYNHLTPSPALGSPTGNYVYSTIRQGNFKLVINGGGNDYRDQYHVSYDGTQINPTGTSAYTNVMLFNLASSPYELTNVASSNPLLVQKMLATLNAYRNSNTWTFYQPIQKGQIAYIHDHYVKSHQFGKLGAYCNNDPDMINDGDFTPIDYGSYCALDFTSNLVPANPPNDCNVDCVFQLFIQSDFCNDA